MCGPLHSWPFYPNSCALRSVWSLLLLKTHSLLRSLGEGEKAPLASAPCPLQRHCLTFIVHLLKRTYDITLPFLSRLLQMRWVELNYSTFYAVFMINWKTPQSTAQEGASIFHKHTRISTLPVGWCGKRPVRDSREAVSFFLLGLELLEDSIYIR